MLILSREVSKQLASSVVTIDDLTFPVQVTKTLAVAGEHGYSKFVCECVRLNISVIQTPLAWSQHVRVSDFVL